MTKSFGGKHMMSSKRSSKFKYKCEKCGNYASSLEHLNMHNNVSSEKKMDKEEIVILDYGNGTKRPRENPNEDIDIAAKKERKGNENRTDAKKKGSTRFRNIQEKTLGARVDTKEDDSTTSIRRIELSSVNKHGATICFTTPSVDSTEIGT